MSSHRAGWALAVDFGTTATTAAIVGGDVIQLVRFGTTTRMPSGVFVDAADGLLAATVGLNRGGADPGRYVRTPKRHVGRDDDVLVAEQEIPVTALVAAVLRTVLREARQQAGGSPPDRVVLTHPARWGSVARGVLVAAATEAGMGSVTLVPEPVAAGQGAVSVASSGARVAVYDLGGGTFDAAVLERTGAGTWVVVGRPGGIDPFGGEAIDAMLHRHLLNRVAAFDRDAAQRLDDPHTAAERGLARTWWRDLRAAKEDLSESTSSSVGVPGTDHAVQVSREELESLVQLRLADTVAETARTIRSAPGAGGEITEILLCGDASHMPMVDRLVRQRFDGIPVRHVEDPKGVVARGAVPAAARQVPTVEPQPEPEPPSPTMPPTTTLPDWELKPALQGVSMLRAPVGSHGSGGHETHKGSTEDRFRRDAVTLPPEGADRESDESVGGSQGVQQGPRRGGRMVLAAVVTVMLVAAAGGGVVWALQGRSSPESDDPPSSSVDSLAGRFSVSASDPDCTADEAVPSVECTTTDPDSGEPLSTKLHRYSTPADARAAFDDRVDELSATTELIRTPTPYHADPADKTGSPTGMLAMGQDAAGDYVFLLQSEEDVAEFAGPEVDTAERAFVEAAMVGSVDANEVFGATFGLSSVIACWPNHEMMLADNDPVSVDCFSKTPGGAATESEVRFQQLPPDEDARTRIKHRVDNTDAKVVKDDQWIPASATEPVGPYVVLDYGENAGEYRYELLWASDDAPQLLAIATGNNLADLEAFWESVAE